MTARPLLEYEVSAHRIDAHGSSAACKDAQIVLDTDAAGRRDAFNPAELLPAALAACMIKGIERVICNALAAATQLSGTVRRAEANEHG